MTYPHPSESPLVNHLLNHESISPIWFKYTRHPILEKLADGSLPERQFKYLNCQNKLYLDSYAVLHEQIKSELSIEHQTELVHYETNAILLTRSIIDATVDQFSLTGNTEDEVRCTEITNYVSHLTKAVDQFKGDWFSQAFAFVPCVLGYYLGIVTTLANFKGNAVSDQDDSLRNTDYLNWLESCASPECLLDCNYMIELLDKYQPSDNNIMNDDKKLNNLVNVFKKSCELEVAYWDSVLKV